jgi:hypothetical protein
VSEAESNENGLQAFETLGQYLRDIEWYPQQIKDRTAYRVLFSGENGQLTCFAQILVDLEQFLFYAVAPVKAPEGLRPAVAEFITRANYGLRIGNLEMDFSDGEVRYKSGLDFEGQELTPQLIKLAIYPAVQTLDRYLPGLMAVIYGGKSAKEAVAEVERSEE